MTMMKKVCKIKKITTSMDAIGAILAVFAVFVGVLLMVIFPDFLRQSIDFLENHEFSELTGGYEVLGGVFSLGLSMFATMAAFILLVLALILFFVFLVPTIHGLVFLKKWKRYLPEETSNCQRAAIKDSIIKIIFNGLPAGLMLTDFIGNRNGVEACGILYLAVICALEIVALVNLKQENEEYY